MHLFGDTAFVSNSCKDQMVRLMPMWQERGTRPGHTTMRHYILLLNTVRIVNIVNHCNYLSSPIFACNHLKTWISNPEKGQAEEWTNTFYFKFLSWIWTHYVKKRHQNKNHTAWTWIWMTKDQALLLTMVSHLKKKIYIKEKKNPVGSFGGLD